MENLKKRIKIIKILSAILVLLLGLCAVKITVQHFTTTSESGKATSSSSTSDGSTYNASVQTTKITALYKKSKSEFNKIGTVAKYVNLKLAKQDKKRGYYKLANCEYYVSAKDIKKVAGFDLNDDYTRYVNFPERITTDNDIKLYNEDNIVAYTLKSSISGDVMMKANDKSYIVFNGELFGVKSKDVAKTAKVSVNKQLAPHIAVCMFHFFYNAAAGETAKSTNYMEISNFKAMIEAAKKAGYESLKQEDVSRYLDGEVQLPYGAYVITMDDNQESVKRLAYPVLEAEKTYGTSFVITGAINNTNGLESKYVELESHTDSMHMGGCSTGHGGIFQCIALDSGIEDLKRSLKKLNNKAIALAYPFGDYNAQEEQATKAAGFKLAYTTQPGYCSPGMDKYDLPRERISTGNTPETFLSIIGG